jgi:hypothetical protein
VICWNMYWYSSLTSRCHVLAAWGSGELLSFSLLEKYQSPQPGHAVLPAVQVCGGHHARVTQHEGGGRLGAVAQG